MQTIRSETISIRGPEGMLHGDLVLPAAARGVVVFAHGSGSSRHSPRNRSVAEALHEVGLGTLLMDLLTEREERAEQLGANLRFDVELLAERLTAATSWLDAAPGTRACSLGYFGASTGAAAALIAAAAHPQRIAAVVSRGGRPDLAPRAVLQRVVAPCLFIVGGSDREVLDLNRSAAAQLRCEHQLDVVPGATHLFEEPGALTRVAQLAGAWFLRWMGSEQSDMCHHSRNEVKHDPA